MGEIINVRNIVEQNKIEIKNRINTLKQKNIVPKLVVILANDDEASKVYVGKKRNLSAELGIDEKEYIFDENITTQELVCLIDELNKDESVDGILVQLPMFKHLEQDKILNSICPEKDVDGFHPLNLGKLMVGNPDVISCTPKGIMTILKSLNVNMEGLNATVVGRSIIVGKPMSQLLLLSGATVTTCHSKTKNLTEHTKNADILVVAAGVPHLITADMVKPGSIVIDVGINRIDGKLTGDVDTENVVKVAKYVTSVPGGVGLTTVVSLIDNVVTIAEKKIK